MVIFDDTDGAEKVELGAQAPTRLDVTTGPIYQQLDAAEKTITEYCDKDTIWEAVETISIKCKDFKLEADMTIETSSGAETVSKSGGSHTVKASAVLTCEGSDVQINPGAPGATPASPLSIPSHKHAPTK